MKTRIFLFWMLTLATVTVYAQGGVNEQPNGWGRRDRHRGGKGNEMADVLQLTDTQKKLFKDELMASHKQILPLQNQLGELVAHQKTLISVDQPDMDQINQGLEQIGKVRIEIAKIRMKHHLAMRSQLTEEQRVKFDVLAARFFDDLKQGVRESMGKRGRDSHPQEWNK